MPRINSVATIRFGIGDQAIACFQQAFDAGFADYPYCYQDHDMGAVREAPGFPDKLRTIRQRYLESRDAMIGTPVVFDAIDDQDESASRPIILLLHGYGDTHESYLDEAGAWASLGFLAVAMP